MSIEKTKRRPAEESDWIEEKKRNARERRKPMKFTKMQGIGNDYVYVNCLQETIENPSELAKEDQ